jgi:hypothetical protein
MRCNVIVSAVLASVIAMAVVSASDAGIFTGRSVSFENGNDGMTRDSFRADLESCVCMYLQPNQTVNNTNQGSSMLAVSCPASRDSMRWGNLSVEKCSADTNECDLTISWYFVGSNGDANAQAMFDGIRDENEVVLSKCPKRVVRMGNGEGLDRPVETTPVITGFVLTLALGYTAFSVVLFASFCLVQRLIVGKS